MLERRIPVGLHRYGEPALKHQKHSLAQRITHCHEHQMRLDCQTSRYLFRNIQQPLQLFELDPRHQRKPSSRLGDLRHRFLRFVQPLLRDRVDVQFEHHSGLRIRDRGEGN